MAEPGSWSSIRRHGLLSTSALLKLFEVSGRQRFLIEAAHRPTSVALQHPAHGAAVIRDQKPMSNAALQRCLQDGLRPADWYRLLNRHVFFWLSRERLDRLLRAKAYRSKRHTILEIDTARLIASCGRNVFLTPINTGSTLFSPQPRGLRTFLRIAEYPYDEWRQRRKGSRDAIVELAVRGAVQNIENVVVRVTDEGAGQPAVTIFTA